MKTIAVILFLAFAIFCGAAIFRTLSANAAAAEVQTLSLNE